ncbi:MAG: hypothetical protein ABFS37_10280 [Acidobacteriota bacterium]
MKKVLEFSFVVIAVLSLVSCAAKEPAEQPAPIVAAEEAAPETIAVIDLEPVEVTAEGTVFDVPVQPEQIPDGAWYCDMGTVHYAQLDEGEGTCPTCGMQLVQKVAAVDEEPVVAADEEPTEEG